MAAGAADWAWSHSRASNGSLLVLLAIAHEADKDGNAEMSMTEIGRKARLSERAVRNAVRDLSALGELSVTEHPGGRHRYNLSTTPAKSAGVPRQDLPPGKICTPEKSAGVKSEHRRSEDTPAKSAALETSDVFVEATGRSLVEVKDVPAKPPKPPRPDVDRLCEHLAGRIEGNGCNRPAITAKWRDAARLMIDKDGRTEADVHKAIDWCQDSEFWRANILSMPKLREQYERLRMQAKRKQNGTHKATTGDRVRQAVEAGKRVQEMLNGGPQ